MKAKKILKFNKQDIADLTKEEQKQVIGGDGGTVGGNCTITCKGKDTCDDLTFVLCYGVTDWCPSFYGGTGPCSPESEPDAATCVPSIQKWCHTDRECTYANCTEFGCPRSYHEVTCTC